MIQLPPVIAGTSALGNLYNALPFEQKKEIVKAFIEASAGPAVFDSAGKYGAGLALETLGQCLEELNIAPHQVVISNKLGWIRTELNGSEPSFEPGVWKDLKHDATQRISSKGIIECFEQGNALLGKYEAQMVSVHDPDEYLFAAYSEKEKQERYEDILSAYSGLQSLRTAGYVTSIGIGSKDWKTIQRISQDVALDWVMFANSLTIYQQPPELLEFVAALDRKGIKVINSAVFHGGFLTGSDFFNYKPVSRNNPADYALYQWRDDFYSICREFGTEPAEACVYFAKQIPGISSIALNSTSARRTRQNVAMTAIEIPPAFWEQMKTKGLIASDYPYL